MMRDSDYLNILNCLSNYTINIWFLQKLLKTEQVSLLNSSKFVWLTKFHLLKRSALINSLTEESSQFSSSGSGWDQRIDILTLGSIFLGGVKKISWWVGWSERPLSGIKGVAWKKWWKISTNVVFMILSWFISKQSEFQVWEKKEGKTLARRLCK